MEKNFHGSGRLILIGALLLAVVGTAWAYRMWHRRAQVTAEKPTIPVTPPVSPSTSPVSAGRPQEKTKSTNGYLDAIRAAYPEFPATQPLGFPLDLSQAAHFILHDPIYLGGGPRTEMWMTRADAPPTEQVLKDAIDQKQDLDVHVLRETVAFVHWMPQAEGPWRPYIVCRKSSGGEEVVSAAYGRRPLPTARDYHWEHAFSWNEKVAVPAGHGVSILTLAPDITESYHELAAHKGNSAAAATYSEPRIMQDGGALLCWLPWEDGKTGGSGAARYVESQPDGDSNHGGPGSWTDLTPEDGWPRKILHMVPMLDGPVLLMAVDEQGAVHVDFKSIEKPLVREEVVEKLVEQLSDSDPKTRKKAYDELSQYGAGIWPMLEKLLDDQGAEAQARMRQLLKQKVTPSLNGMALLGKKSVKLAARLSDGGTVFLAEGGVTIPDPEHPDADPDYRVPAWISIRPGQPIELLPQGLTDDLIAGKSRLDVQGNNWIVTGDARGARRFVGNGFVPLLRKNEHGFSDFVGVDRRGRWLFRQPSLSATAPTIVAPASPPTLVIDPTLPDPTSRLPIWIYESKEGVGWTQAGWPVAKNKDDAYALHENGWELLEAGDTILTQSQDAPPPVETATPTAIRPDTSPSTSPSASTTLPAATSPAVLPPGAVAATMNAEAPILTDREGRRYYGGLTDLRVVSPSGQAVTWTLPALAHGQGPAALVRTSDKRLFLFNQPGRILRIKPGITAAEPFVLEKTFTHRVPTVEHPTRIWLDPAGRIIMAYENRLGIFFPTGYVPPAIADLMRPEGIDDGDE